MSQPRARTGALVGALLTAPLVALLFLARQAVGLPFVPFDIFDWLARTLPGGLVTTGIDAIVAVLRGAGAPDLSTAAKAAEQTLAVTALLLVGAVAGAAAFGILHRHGGRALPAGLIAGAALGAPAAWISATRGVADTGPLVGTLWILTAFLAWGALLGWSWLRLVRPGEGAGDGPDATGHGTDGRDGRREVGPDDAAIRIEPVDRRRFLIRLGGATAAITVAGAGVGSIVGSEDDGPALPGGRSPWSSRNPLPNAGAGVEPVPGTRPELTPVEDHYRIDINTRVPRVEGGEWRLTVDGLVEHPAELSLEELRTRYEPVHRLITLACISNPIAGDLIGTTRWTGLPLRDLLEDVRPDSDATHLRVRSVDGFHETVALELVRSDPRLMLAYAWDGLPLRPEHGYPLRIYIPDRYGMKQPKWIESIEVTAEYEPGYWVSRGWSREARMRATSVIDVIASQRMADEDGRPGTVPVGGIAHAGDRGISRVEVRTDDGPWQPARLREPLSGLTWVLWRYDWAFQPGDHTLTVRCVDGEGNPQIAERSPVRPDGATGLHSRTADL